MLNFAKNELVNVIKVLTQCQMNDLLDPFIKKLSKKILIQLGLKYDYNNLEDPDTLYHDDLVLKFNHLSGQNTLLYC